MMRVNEGRECSIEVRERYLRALLILKVCLFFQDTVAQPEERVGSENKEKE